MAGTQIGVKESREAIIAVFALVKLVFDVAKDGIQYTDALKLFYSFLDSAFRKTIDDGVKGASLIRSELFDLTEAERSELWTLINQKVGELRFEFNMSPKEADELMESLEDIIGRFRV